MLPAKLQGRTPSPAACSLPFNSLIASVIDARYVYACVAIRAHDVIAADALETIAAVVRRIIPFAVFGVLNFRVHAIAVLARDRV